MIDIRLRDVSGAPAQWRHFWPLLMGPTAVVLAVLASFFYKGFATLDTPLDRIAPWVLLVAAGMYWVRAIVTRNFLYTILTVVAGTLLLRELHWSPTIKIAAYPMLVVCGVWMLVCRDLLAEPFRDRRHTIWLIAVVATYVLSQLIERRVFRFIPGESDIHSKIEESVELAGHLALVIASLVGNWDFYEIKQSRCSLRRGFEISPTGQTLAKLKRRSARQRATGGGFVTDIPSRNSPDETQSPRR